MAKTKKELAKEYAVEFARKGGKARAKALTPEQRKEISRKGNAARWAKKKEPKR
jgi:general stress protein YciG